MKFTGTYAEQAQQVLEIIDAATYCEVEDYSGRGMYGKYCMSVTLPKHEVETFFFDIGRYMERKGIDTPSQFLSFSTDSMGLDGTVIYWRAYMLESETDEA